MKQLLDFLPLVVFFIFIRCTTFCRFRGTHCCHLGSSGLYLAEISQSRKMTLVTAAMVLVFGTLTLAFHSDLFIKWKVTVLYVLFALALLVSQWVMKKPLIQRMLGKVNLT